MQNNDELINALVSASNSEKVLLLQKVFAEGNRDFARANIDFFSRLTSSNDVAICFWAKKILSLVNSEEIALAKSEQNLPEQSQSLESLIKRLVASQSSFVAMEILKKIFEKHDPASKEPLKSYLKKCNDNTVLSFLVKNFGACFPEESTMTVLMPFLKHSDVRVVCNCIEGIAKVKSPKITLLLVQLLESNEHRVKATAAQMLIDQEPSVARNVINQMLQTTGKPHFVISACQAIKTIKDPAFLPSLVHLATIPLFSDISVEVIEAIGGEVALGYLEPLSELNDPEISRRVDEAKKRILLKMKVGEPLAEVIEVGKGKLKELGQILQKKISSSSANGSPPNKSDIEQSRQPGEKNEEIAQNSATMAYSVGSKIRGSLQIERFSWPSPAKVAKILVVGLVCGYLYMGMNPAPPVVAVEKVPSPVQNTFYGKRAVIDAKILDDSEHFVGKAEFFLKATSSINSGISILLPLNVGKYAGQRHVQINTPFLHSGENDETLTFELLDDDKLNENECNNLTDAIGAGAHLACIAGKVYSFQYGFELPPGGEEAAVSLAKTAGKIILESYTGSCYKSCGIAEYKVNKVEQGRQRDVNSIVIRDGNKAKVELAIFYK